MKRPFKILPFIIVFFFNPNLCHAQPNAPIKVVKLFDRYYGGPSMDEIADYTTPRFRNNRPKSVWVVDTWKALRRLKYERINSNITDSRALGNKAVVAVEAKINTAAGEITQKEIYYLVKEGEDWLIDELLVTDEEIDLEKLVL